MSPILVGNDFCGSVGGNLGRAKSSPPAELACSPSFRIENESVL